jgi:hypothetical protein
MRQLGSSFRLFLSLSSVSLIYVSFTSYINSYYVWAVFASAISYIMISSSIIYSIFAFHRISILGTHRLILCLLLRIHFLLSHQCAWIVVSSVGPDFKFQRPSWQCPPEIISVSSVWLCCPRTRENFPGLHIQMLRHLPEMRGFMYERDTYPFLDTFLHVLYKDTRRVCIKS